MSERHYPRSHFRPLQATDLQQVWQWRNQPEIRQNMHSPAPISWQQHLTWFEQLQQDGQRSFFVFWQNDRPIGVLNFHWHTAEMLEWGCYLGEPAVWPGSGLLLEIAALDFAADQANCHTLYAEVLSFNQSVLKMHQLFGYQPLPDKAATDSPRAGRTYCIKVFHYPTELWRSQRAEVLRRLPRQIRAAADLIEFQLEGTQRGFKATY